MISADMLYEITPDCVFLAPDGYTWYAAYESCKTFLTNASGELEAYSYPDKSEFREVRRFIIKEYDLFVVDDLDDE